MAEELYGTTDDADETIDSMFDVASNSAVSRFVKYKLNSTIRRVSLFNDIMKGVKSKYIVINKFTMYDRVCFNNKSENKGRIVDKTAPEMAYAIFGKRPLYVDEYDYWHMTGFPKGVYKKRLDHKTIAIMSVSQEFYTPNINQREIETNSYTAYYIYIIGANADYWNKKLTKRSYMISLKLDVLQRNINSGILSVGGYYCGSTPAKDLDAIIVDESIVNNITSAIDRFIANKDLYAKYHIPYRLGILLYGKPGTGKSALIKAIARKYHKKLTFVGRNNLDNITDYDATTYEINNSFLVIEEIDTLLEERKDAKNNLGKEVITSAIDALDNGVILFATTNYYEKIMKIESSIIRPGRFSIHVELKYFDREYAERMVDKFGIEDKSFLDTLEYPICPSKLEFICTEIRFAQLEKED